MIETRRLKNVVIFIQGIIVNFLFEHLNMKYYFENHLSVNRSFMKISYKNNVFNNDFNNSNTF